MSTLHTPGIYVEELGSLPPAIHADDTHVTFIGYTQYAQRRQPDDLHLQPTTIHTLSEFEQLFGHAAPATECQLKLDLRQGKAMLTSLQPAPFYLYAALQLYFANQGGTCTIISVGNFAASTPQCDALLAGLDCCSTTPASLLVCPEACALPIQDYARYCQAVLAQCACLRDRFTILDLHSDAFALSQPNADLLHAYQRFNAQDQITADRSYGAMYAPCLRTTLHHAFLAENVMVTLQDQASEQANPLTLSLATLRDQSETAYQACLQAIQHPPLILPPSAAVAGIYAHVDRQFGIWKAPVNVSLLAVQQPCTLMDERTQSILNADNSGEITINSIRLFRGKGTRLWGARTMQGKDPDWRYVSVRRLGILIERSIKPALQPFIFEANDQQVWDRVKAMIENWLHLLWRQGALQGQKPEEAYFVQVGLGRSMTAQDILAGHLKVTLGFAPIRPAEFIMVTFEQTLENGD